MPQTGLESVTRMVCRGEGLPPKGWERSWQQVLDKWSNLATAVPNTWETSCFEEFLWFPWGKETPVKQTEVSVQVITGYKNSSYISGGADMRISRLKTESSRPPGAGLKAPIRVLVVRFNSMGFSHVGLKIFAAFWNQQSVVCIYFHFMAGRLCRGEKGPRILSFFSSLLFLFC